MNEGQPQRRSVFQALLNYRLALLIIVTVALVVGGVFYYKEIRPVAFEVARVRLQVLLSSVTSPREVRSATFVLASGGGPGGIYSDANSMFRSRTLPGVDPSSTIINVAKKDTHIGLILSSINEGKFVTRVVLDGKTLYSGPELITDLAISPDGTQVTYALAKTTAPDFAKLGQEAGKDYVSPYTDTKLWTVYRASLSSTAPEQVGVGYAPAFLDGGRIIYAAPNGLAVWDVISKNSTVLMGQTFPAPAAIRIAVSPDGTMLAVSNPHTNLTTVYKRRVGSLSLERSAFYTITGEGSITLTDTHLYHLVSEKNKPAELWQYPFVKNAEGTKVRTFPVDFPLVKMIP